ncbi:MAG TPA: hypothetical protein VNI55_12330 [Gaiellaceae bacterium]|nr:hypothetical protein [Gaiellaceae bacterium]
MKPADALKLAAYEAETAVQAAQVAVKAAQPPAPIDPRDPRSEVYRELAAMEPGVLARLSPVRNRWPDIGRFDGQVNELEQRRAELVTDLQAVRLQLDGAIDADRQALADWTLSGGRRPEPSAPKLEQRVHDLEAELEAAAVAIERVLAEKVDYVSRHRARLVKEAEKATREAHVRYSALIAELEAAREELRDSRQSVLWAALHPSETLNASFPTHIALGRAKPVEAALPGYRSQIALQSLIGLLKADADLLAEAISTEQLEALGRKSDASVTAVWAGSDEDRDRERSEKERRIADYAREWGFRPPEFTG